MAAVFAETIEAKLGANPGAAKNLADCSGLIPIKAARSRRIFGLRKGRAAWAAEIEVPQFRRCDASGILRFRRLGSAAVCIYPQKRLDSSFSCMEADQAASARVTGQSRWP